MSETAPEESPAETREDDPGGDGDLVEEFLATYDRLRTRKSYRHDLRAFFGSGPVEREEAASVGPEAAVRFLKEVASEKGRSAARRRRAALRSFYEWLQKEGPMEAGEASRFLEATAPSIEDLVGEEEEG